MRNPISEYLFSGEHEVFVHPCMYVSYLDPLADFHTPRLFSLDNVARTNRKCLQTVYRDSLKRSNLEQSVLSSLLFLVNCTCNNWISTKKMKFGGGSLSGPEIHVPSSMPPSGVPWMGLLVSRVNHVCSSDTHGTCTP